MKIQRESTPTEVQHALFCGGAIAIQLEALVDPEEHATVFVVTARDVGANKLIALWSTPPRGWENQDQALQEALAEMTRLVYEHTGPF